ncbi:MAG: glycosyltransferase family 2 protein [Burkholderiales bacterium]|nr:glycosyltransferase family 2 protein [Burkholderiales bacterium]
MRRATAVVIVNWNNWRDTIACLDSLVCTLGSADTVIVCDNGSTDGSLDMLQKWARGEHDAATPPFIAQSTKRPLPFVHYERGQAESGGKPDDPQFVLVSTGANLGFAGGCNVGLRYALARDYAYCWLLNNDTVVTPTTLPALRQRMDEDETIGMCGSTLAYLHEPDTVQALGGAQYDPARGTGKHIGVGQPIRANYDISAVEAQIDYVVGASMLVSNRFLRTVGLMAEDYFLYYEEIDWACRARGRFRCGWAPASVVYHKEGGSIGSSHRTRPSATSLHYLYRNRLHFARKHFPHCAGRIARAVLLDALVYFKRRDFEATKIILGALFAAPTNPRLS